VTPCQHTALERSLLNDYQRDFPLRPHPFEILAEQLSTDEGTVLELLHRLQDKGVISRLGPVFRPNTVGASTLAAASVPESRLETVAAYINQFPEVNHNYEREHRFNLWFVVNAATEARREAVLSGIASHAGLEVMSLPLLRDYYIDLGFDIDFSDVATRGGLTSSREPRTESTHTTVPPVPIGDLIPLLQEGLPLTHAPYAEIGSRIGLSGEDVLEQIDNMLTAGTIKRFGVVVRHHELGYRANAMCVWDIGDGSVDELGRSMAEVPFVTLCYRRPRWMPNWPYNLFCMIHGKDRETVLAQVDQLNEEFDLRGIAQDILFSGRRFKQQGACFSASNNAERKDGHVAYG
jgi:DNA-binding Lrp family transcriptional regulator